MAKRKRLNAEFIKLNKGQKVFGKFLGYGEKRVRDLTPEGEEQFDDNGECLMKTVRTLRFESDNGIPFQMFESGGLKAAAECFEVGKSYEIEGGDMKDIGKNKRVRDMAVYGLED